MISLAAHFPLCIETWQVNLAENYIGIGSTDGVKALANALSVNASLTSCNVRLNQLDVESAELLVKAVEGKDVSLCGITPSQTTADFGRLGEPLKHGPGDAVLLASDLSKSGVTASMTYLR